MQTEKPLRFRCSVGWPPAWSGALTPSMRLRIGREDGATTSVDRAGCPLTSFCGPYHLRASPTPSHGRKPFMTRPFAPSQLIPAPSQLVPASAPLTFSACGLKADQTLALQTFAHYLLPDPWKGNPPLAQSPSPHTGSFKWSQKEFSHWQALLTNQRPSGQ